MKLIAHRGWSAGPEENSLRAVRRAAAAPDVSGVELDLRRGADGRLVVSHDPPEAGAPTFAAVAEAIAGTGLELFLEVKERGLVADAARVLAAHGLAPRALLFGFEEVVEPWEGERPVRLGVIARYPWEIARLAARHKPDVILLGWDERAWTRRAFRLWWGTASLRRMGARHGAAVVVGVAQRRADLRWLARQGIEAATADMDLL